MKPYTSSLQSAVDALAAAQRELNRAVAHEQLSCVHSEVVECDYKKLYESALAPMRLCCACGMTEDGWGPGYLVLCGQATRADREDVYRRRLGVHIGDDDKGPLLRKETTVVDLVNKKFGLTKVEETAQ